MVLNGEECTRKCEARILELQKACRALQEGHTRQQKIEQQVCCVCIKMVLQRLREQCHAGWKHQFIPLLHLWPIRIPWPKGLNCRVKHIKSVFVQPPVDFLVQWGGGEAPEPRRKTTLEPIQSMHVCHHPQ